ncbi:MAG: T9SS type A sorting domain-containing protein, partial [Bacteroidales bacterium]|nr:T9SS type A sorting domain-containing protein [Bacteroidales bacterium]
TAQNETHLETMVTKFINNERTPPTDPYFYNNPVTALGFQSDRWFQICSESVAGFWEVNQGKTTTRINVGPCGSVWSTNQNTPLVMAVFGPDGLGYIPATPGEVNCSWNGTGSDVINAINNGAFMLQHRDHGGVTGWSHPSFSNSDINSLNNTDLTFVWSINCLTGKFNASGECFAEKFHRHTSGGNNSGTIGIIAASDISYSFVNDTYVWGAYDNMWPDFLPDIYAPQVEPEPRGVLPGFGNAAGKYFLEQSDWPYNTNNKEVTYYLFHHHGDAFMTVYSEIPQNLTVTHNPILYAGVTSFDISANEGSLIALTVNGEIIGTAEGTGAPLSITIPGQVPPNQMLVTITLQNYYRYEALVDVVPPVGPYIVRESYTINDVAGGNGDGLMDYGETNLLSLAVKNVGVAIAYNITVTLSTTDSYITITDNTEFYGDIDPDEIVIVDDGFAYDVANDIPDGHNVPFEVSATDGDSTWLSYFSIQAHAPALEMDNNIVISDPTGNNNGKIDPGETVDIFITVNNTGSSEAYQVNGGLLTTDTYITINSGQLVYGDIIGGGNAEQSFSVTADIGTPIGHLVDFTFDITANLGITGNGAFNVVVGQIPVVIVDLDPNASSGPDMETAIQNLGVAIEYTTSFPTDPDLYSSIFVCLGIYSSNHVLSSSQGQALADFLNNGGSLYMEGGDTWYYDSQTAVHPMFNINPVDDGDDDLGTILGQTGTFTEDMSFTYSGENNYIDHINPISPAFMIFENQSPNYGTGVAYDAGTYRTIGASHEFGGLVDGTSPSTQEELMAEYLDFLGVSTTLNASFSSNVTDICEGETVDFVDMSSGQVISWDWSFPGGNPSSSTQENPSVTYNTIGSYDVTLIVGDGVDFDTLTVTDYITVNTIPSIPGTPFGDSIVCTNLVQYSDYTTSGSPNATSYIWEILPVEAGTISGNGTTGTVEWIPWEGTATIKVKGVNVCGESDFSDGFEVECVFCTEIDENSKKSNIEIFPNPTSGKLSIKFNIIDNNKINIKIINLLSKIIYQEKVTVIKNNIIDIDLSEFSEGVYFIRVEGKSTNYFQKFIINK